MSRLSALTTCLLVTCHAHHLSRSFRPASQQSRGLTPSWERGETSLTWHEAQRWCRSRGLRAVSVDSASKAREVLGFLSRSDQVYFWTGGKKVNPFRGDSVRWANGATEDVRQGQYPWSVNGQTSKGQPDGGLSETCIAALNIDFYPDGAKLHDVGCEHRKPVLCE